MSHRSLCILRKVLGDIISASVRPQGGGWDDLSSLQVNSGEGLCHQISFSIREHNNGARGVTLGEKGLRTSIPLLQRKLTPRNRGPRLSLSLAQTFMLSTCSLTVRSLLNTRDSEKLARLCPRGTVNHSW